MRSGSDGIRPDRLHGRRQVDRRRASSPRALGGARARQRRAAGGALRHIRRPGVRAARRGVRSARTRRSSCASCSSAPARDDVIALGGGSVLSERVRERARRPRHRPARRRPGPAWERVHAQPDPERPLARDRDAFAAPARRAPRRSTRSSPTRFSTACRRDRRARVGALRALASAPGHAHAVGERGLGRLPGARRAAGCWRRATAARRSCGRSTARARAPFCVTDETVGESLRRPARASSRRRSRSRPASGTRRWPAPSACGSALVGGRA